MNFPPPAPAAGGQGYSVHDRGNGLPPCHKPPLIFFIEQIHFLPAHKACVHEPHSACLAAGPPLAFPDAVDRILAAVLPRDPARSQKPFSGKFRQNVHIDLRRIHVLPVTSDAQVSAVSRSLLLPSPFFPPCRLHSIASQSVPAYICICMRHLLSSSFRSVRSCSPILP